MTHLEQNLARHPVDGLVVPVSHLNPATIVNDVAELFALAPDVDAFPIVDGARPVGLVTRAKLSRRLFTHFGYALFGRKPIATLFPDAPVVAVPGMGLEEILDLALARPADDIYDDIVAVDGTGACLGLIPIREVVVRQSRTLAESIAQREIARKHAEEVEKVGRLKSQFLTNVTHELRAPVNTMIGMAELLKVAMDTGNTEKGSRYAALLLTSAANLRSLVNNVLDLAKIEAGKMTVTAGHLDARDAVREVVEALRFLVREKPVAVDVRLPDRPLEMLTDPVLVRQILTNLGSNAVKFTERGSVVIAAEAEGAVVRFTVSDTGAGIAREDWGKLFVAFSQLEDPTTKRNDGTGLGLVITGHLISLLQGRIHFDSVPGDGTVFTVILPAEHNRGGERA